MMKRSFQQSFSIVGETSGKSSIFSRLALAMVVSGWTSTTLAGLVHEYTFNGTTADSFSGAAMVLPNPSGLGAGGYTFGEGEGPESNWRHGWWSRLSLLHGDVIFRGRSR